MKRIFRVSLALVLFSLMIVGAVQAQTPVPNGSIRGAVYRDVNGDGKCVGTNVAGEVPIPNIDILFVSDDGKTSGTLYTGSDGTYGLVAAGFSNWSVYVKPGAEWKVTSEPMLKAWIYPEKPLILNINFCLQKASDVVVVLPKSGAPGFFNLTTFIALVGVSFLSLGVIVEWRQRHQVIG